MEKHECKKNNERKESSNTHAAYKDISYQTISLWKNKIAGYLPETIYTDFPMTTSKTEKGPNYFKWSRIHFPWNFDV